VGCGNVMKSGKGRRLAAAAILLAGLLMLADVFSLSLTERSAAERDFIGYWAAGQQLAHGANPYDAKEVLRLEKVVGLGNLQIKITPSPRWDWPLFCRWVFSVQKPA